MDLQSLHPHVSVSTHFSANGDRAADIPWDNLYPDYNFAYNFTRRHRLSLQSTMYLSEKRAEITPELHAKWARLIEEIIFKPELADAFKDPRRIFNNVGAIFIDL